MHPLGKQAATSRFFEVWVLLTKNNYEYIFIYGGL